MKAQNLDQIALHTGLNTELLKEICSLAKISKLDKVVIFGSRARGDYSRASDIDLAVTGGDITEFTLEVEEKTSTLLSYDVLDLNASLHAALREAIHKEGIVLYEKI
ncbi:MAG: nucleotidyltransferase domain-containing protein [Lachnospiraceae bacterium]|nr:nucleotidyltransferase domain-containing protein [Lachnospiraceae bacterium]